MIHLLSVHVRIAFLIDWIKALSVWFSHQFTAAIDGCTSQRTVPYRCVPDFYVGHIPRLQSHVRLVADIRSPVYG